jgi:hypothetical protein
VLKEEKASLESAYYGSCVLLSVLSNYDRMEEKRLTLSSGREYKRRYLACKVLFL